MGNSFTCESVSCGNCKQAMQEFNFDLRNTVVEQESTDDSIEKTPSPPREGRKSIVKDF